MVERKNNNFLSLPEFDVGSTCSIFFLILVTTNHFWSRIPLWGRICWQFHGQNWQDSDGSCNCVHTMMPFESVLKLCHSIDPHSDVTCSTKGVVMIFHTLQEVPLSRSIDLSTCSVVGRQSNSWQSYWRLCPFSQFVSMKHYETYFYSTFFTFLFLFSLVHAGCYYFYLDLHPGKSGTQAPGDLANKYNVKRKRNLWKIGWSQNVADVGVSWSLLSFSGQTSK